MLQRKDIVIGALKFKIKHLEKQGCAQYSRLDRQHLNYCEKQWLEKAIEELKK
jgi:hypothetical protein